MSSEMRPQQIEKLLKQYSENTESNVKELIERLPNLIEFCKSVPFLKSAKYREYSEKNVDTPALVRSITKTVSHAVEGLATCGEYIIPSYKKPK